MRRSLVSVVMLVSTGLLAQGRLDSARTTWIDTTRSFTDRTVALAFYSFYDSTWTPQTATNAALGTADADTSGSRFKRQLGLVHCGFALRSTWLDDHDAALVHNEVARSIFAGIHDKMNLARTDAAIGGNYLMMGRLGEAMPYLQASVTGLENGGDTLAAVGVMENIAYALQLQGNGPLALQWCRKALAVLGGGHRDEQAAIHMRIGAIHIEAGDARATLATMDTAQAMLDAGAWVDHRDDIGAVTGEALVLLGDCAGGLRRIQRSLDLNRGRSDRNDMLAYLYARLARGYLCAKEHDEAIRAAREGLRIAEAHDLRNEAMENLEYLALAYEGTGDLFLALAYNRRYHALNDSLMGARSASAVTSVLLGAEFDKQQFADSLLSEQRQVEATIALQKERARRNLLLAGAAVALVFGTFSYRQRRRTQRALERSDELLLNILPEEVAEELKAKGHADAKHFDNVTILFTDFKGFTEASEKLSPQELVEELNTCFKAFDGIITARGIEKIKTIGDAYMCAGGLPVPASSTPAGVVQAALEMQAFMVARKKESDALGKPAFEMRVGIHTGPVVAGIVGVKKFAYDIWGDTVNIASRMESSGEVGQVNISEATYRLVKDRVDLHFTPRGQVQAKGKGEMDMYFVRHGHGEG